MYLQKQHYYEQRSGFNKQSWGGLPFNSNSTLLAKYVNDRAKEMGAENKVLNSQVTGSAVTTCPACESPVSAEDTFCKKCGASLRAS